MVIFLIIIFIVIVLVNYPVVTKNKEKLLMNMNNASGTVLLWLYVHNLIVYLQNQQKVQHSIRILQPEPKNSDIQHSKGK